MSAAVRRLVLAAVVSAVLASVPSGSALAADTTVAADTVRATAAPGAVECRPPDAVGGDAARGREGDHPALPRAAAVDIADRLAAERRRSAVVDPIWIPTRVHLIRGTHSSDRWVTRDQVRRQLRLVNRAMAGGQSETSAPAPFRLYVHSWTSTRWDRWYHAQQGSFAERRMRAQLHEGTRRSLNLFITRPTPDAQGEFLGWSSLAWNAQRSPQLDGVVLNLDSMPGGRIQGANRGDTLVHEVGHWLGLFHTFEYGCDPQTHSDLVQDTPMQGGPSSGCPEGADTCPSDPGTDPVHDFMDYSDDACLTDLTPGQVDLAMLAWREHRTL